MFRTFAASAVITALTLASAPGAFALDTYHGAIKRDGKQIAMGQDVKMLGGAVFRKQKVKGKKKQISVAVGTPVTLRVESFGIGNPRGACAGTPENPNYCDDFVGGYIPDYAARITVTNAANGQAEGILGTIVCSDSTSSTVQSSLVTSSMPARTADSVTVQFLLPRGLQDPATCVEPLLVLTSMYSVGGLQGKPVLPRMTYLPLSGIPLK